MALKENTVLQKRICTRKKLMSLLMRRIRRKKRLKFIDITIKGTLISLNCQILTAQIIAINYLMTSFNKMKQFITSYLRKVIETIMQGSLVKSHIKVLWGRSCLKIILVTSKFQILIRTINLHPLFNQDHTRPQVITKCKENQQIRIFPIFK